MAETIQFETWQIWAVILGLGLGTYAIRLSFLGLIGNRPLPPMLLRFLRYTPMAVIPGSLPRQWSGRRRPGARLTPPA